MFPVNVEFKNVVESEQIKAHINHEAEKLEREFHNIEGCRVIISSPQKPHIEGNIYHMNINLQVPGHELIVNFEPDPQKYTSQEDPYGAIGDAFTSMENELIRYFRKGKVERIH